jgi:hypothetical protein
MTLEILTLLSPNSITHVPVRAREYTTEILDIAGIPIGHIASETGAILEERTHGRDFRGIPRRNDPVKGIGLFEHAAQIRGTSQLPGGQVLIEGCGFPEHGIKGDDPVDVPPQHGSIVDSGTIEL